VLSRASLIPQRAGVILIFFSLLQHWEALVQVRDQVRVAQVHDKLKVHQ